MDKRIFIERPRNTGSRRIDRKKNLILRQKVVIRRVTEGIRTRATRFTRQGNQAYPRPGIVPKGVVRQSPAPREFAGALVRFLQNKRRTLLWVSLFLMVCASFVPLYINFHSFVWEKGWTVAKEEEPLYGIFLDRSGPGFTGSGKNAPQGDGQGTIQDPLTDGTGGASLHESPGSAPAAESPVPSLTVKEYTVRPGDSLFGIAAKFGVPIDGIISASDLKNARFIQAGTVLRVPSMKGIVYRVKKGDNLSSIALKYDARVNDIADVNDLSGQTIRPGQELFVPGASLSEWERAIALGSFQIPHQGETHVEGRLPHRPVHGQDGLSRGYRPVGFRRDSREGGAVRAGEFHRRLRWLR
jgi:LysM repeat protein